MAVDEQQRPCPSPSRIATECGCAIDPSDTVDVQIIQHTHHARPASKAGGGVGPHRARPTARRHAKKWSSWNDHASSSRSAKRAPLMAYVPGPNQVREVRTAARGCCQHLRLSNCRPEMLVNGGLMPAASRSRSRSLATVRTVCEQHKRADLLWMLCAAPHGAPRSAQSVVNCSTLGLTLDC